MAQTKADQNPMRHLQEDIENRSFARCYLLYGTESYLIRQYREKLTDAIIPAGDSMNLSSFTGSFDEQTVTDLAETMPFFNDYRLIVLEDSGIFRGKSDRISEYLTHIPETTIFLFTEYPTGDPKNPEKKTAKNVDKRSKSYKAVTKYGFAAELNTPSSDDLAKWVAGQIRRENKKITRQTLNLFLSRCSSDMNQIRQDLEKLLCYTLDQDSISDADVEAICMRRPEDHIFQMIDAISSKNRAQAFAMYSDLVELRTPPGRILYLISDQYANLLQVKELREKGMRTAQIACETGMRRFVADKCSRLSERYTTQELSQCLNACISAEEAFKTGHITDQMSVELLITELTM